MRSRSDRVFDMCNVTLLCVVLLVVMYPLYYTVIASFSNPLAVSGGKVVSKPGASVVRIASGGHAQLVTVTITPG